MKVLVIQQKMIGDVLVSTVIAQNLKRQFPNAQVDYLIEPFTQAVVENNPYIDNIILFDKTENIFSYALKIRKIQYDVVIDAYDKLSSGIITFFSGAKKRISYKRTKWLDYVFYNLDVPNIDKPRLGAGNGIESRLNLLNSLFENKNPQLRPKLYLTESELQKGKQILLDNKVDFSKKIYMISILGSSADKSYPDAYMAEILDFIVKKTDATLLFNFMPKQLNDVLKIYNLCLTETKKHINLEANGKSIREFLAVTHYCNAVLGNEGGAINMAKALEKPTFTIFSTWINKLSWNSFEDGKHTVHIHLKDVKPELYGNKTAKQMKNKSLELYIQFTPELIFPSLEKYLNEN
jgi:ADP-heptose:LPS heptosyltransferase